MKYTVEMIVAQLDGLITLNYLQRQEEIERGDWSGFVGLHDVYGPEVEEAKEVIRDMVNTMCASFGTREFDLMMSCLAMDFRLVRTDAELDKAFADAEQGICSLQLTREEMSPATRKACREVGRAVASMS